MVEQLDSRELSQRVKAANDIKAEIQGATSTMTSVPKPLKFLNPNYPKMREIFEKQTDSEFKVSKDVPIVSHNINHILSKLINQRMDLIIGYVRRHSFTCRHGFL